MQTRELCLPRLVLSQSFLSFLFLFSLFVSSLPRTLFTFKLRLILFSSSPAFSRRLFLHKQVYKPARMTPPRGKADHLLYFLLFCLSAKRESYAVSRAYEGSALYRQVKRSSPTCVEGESQNNFIGEYWLPPWSTVHAWTLDVNEVVGINKAISQCSNFISTLKLLGFRSSTFSRIFPPDCN